MGKYRIVSWDWGKFGEETGTTSCDYYHVQPNTLYTEEKVSSKDLYNTYIDLMNFAPKFCPNYCLLKPSLTNIWNNHKLLLQDKQLKMSGSAESLASPVFKYWNTYLMDEVSQHYTLKLGEPKKYSQVTLPYFKVWDAYQP